MDPNRPDIAREAGERVLSSDSLSEVEDDETTWPETSNSPPTNLPASPAKPEVWPDIQRFRLSRSKSSLSDRSISPERGPDPIACDVCEKPYFGKYRRGNLARHKRLYHGESIITYPCEDADCQQRFVRQDARLKHYLRRHPHLAPKPSVPAFHWNDERNSLHPDDLAAPSDTTRDHKEEHLLRIAQENLVAPPSILRKLKEKFPKDPDQIRPGVVMYSDSASPPNSDKPDPSQKVQFSGSEGKMIAPVARSMRTVSPIRQMENYLESTSKATDRLGDVPKGVVVEKQSPSSPPPYEEKRGKDILPGARWTKIDSSLVDPEALEEAGERFEEREDCVIVLRVLTRTEFGKLAERTREIRGARPSRISRESSIESPGETGLRRVSGNYPYVRTRLAAEEDTDHERSAGSRRQSWDVDNALGASSQSLAHRTRPNEFPLGDDEYSYMDPTRMYRETEPAWRRPREGTQNRPYREKEPSWYRPRPDSPS